MYNLESDEFNSINNQDHYLCGNILPILEKFKLKHFIENYNEEKEIIEIQNKSYQLSQEIDIKSIGNNQNLMHPKNSIIKILCESPYIYPKYINIIIIMLL